MKRDDYPVVLTVREVASILRLGINKTYEIVREPGFPAFKHGNRIIVPRDSFFRWLDNRADPSNNLVS